MRAIPVFVLAGLILLAVLLVSAASAGRARSADPHRYRPRGGHRKAQTRFEDEPEPAGTRRADGPAPTDFFTGAAIDPEAGIVRCDDCRAFYHPDTVALLAEHNDGRCASCGSTALHALDAAAWRRSRRAAPDDGPRRDRALVPEPSTPEAYAAAIGRMVAVSVEVGTRVPARRGADPSLLVHDARGHRLRLVFVGRAFGGLRGRARVDGLIGSAVRAHGLLLRDEAHGLRLLVSDPAMVREIRA
jgi:hypothetical protein